VTEEDDIEVGWLQVHAKQLGLHLRTLLAADPPGTVAIYIQEMRCFPGRRFQTNPPSLAKFLSITHAQEVLADYKAAYPGGRNRDV
jgi:hypothetical protein